MLRWSALACVLSAAACGAADRARAPLLELQQVDVPARPGSGEPNLFAAPDGRVYLSWLEPSRPSAAASTRSGRFSLRFASFTAAGTESGTAGIRWSDVRTIATGDRFFVNWADFPSIIELPDGSLAAHWLVRHGTGAYGYHVHIARSTDGGRTWSGDMIPHRDRSSTEHGFVSLFPWVDGRFAAVWLDGRKFAGSGASHGGGGSHGEGGGAEMTLRFTTIAADGTLGPERLLDGRVCDCCQTGAALTSNGPIVVYRNRSQREIRDIYITRFVDDGWTQPEPVHRDGWVIPACPVNGPAVAARGTRVAVAWFTAAENLPRTFVAFSNDAGASFAAPVRVDEGSPAGRVDVILLPGEAALVSWLERTPDGGAEIRVRRVGAAGDGRGSVLGPSMIITRSSAARASGFPRMVRAGEHVIFAWTDPGNPSRVRMAVARLPDAGRPPIAAAGR